MFKTNQCQVGQVLPGGYKVKEALGEGGYAYVCHAEKDGQEYAVKVQEANLAAYTEASLLNVLNHPNIIKPVETILIPVDNNVINDTFYIYQPRGIALVPGSGVNLLAVIFKLLSALAYLESNGLIHCDIKPANIVLLGHEPVLIDFGVCEFCPGSQRVEPIADDISGRRHINQTAWYRAPEMWRQDTYDARIDVFSLGCCLYKWLSGKSLFQAETLTAFEQQLDQVPTKLAALMATLPDQNRVYYQQLLEIMLSPREQRVFASQLVTVLTGLTTLNLQPITAVEPSWLYSYPLRFKLQNIVRQDTLDKIASLLNMVGITGGSATVDSLNNSTWSILNFTLLRQLINMVASRKQYLEPEVTFMPGGQGQLSAGTISRAVSLVVFITTRCDDYEIYHNPLLVAHDLAEFFNYNNNSILPKILLNRHNFVSDQLFLTNLTAKVIPVYYRNIATVKWDDWNESQARAILKEEATK